MRILHFSDLHIGVENYGRPDPATGLSTRLGDFLAALDEVVDCALEERVDLVLLAGDAYKGRDPSQTHQREFARRLSRLSNAGIPTFMLVGNHDLPNAVSRATAVEIFQTLQVPHVYIGDSLQIYHVPTPSGPLQILAVPWPRRGGIMTREDSRGLSIDEIRQELENRLTVAIQDRLDRLNPEVPAILTGHLTVNGATTGTERSMMLGQDHVLLASSLAPTSAGVCGPGAHPQTPDIGGRTLRWWSTPAASSGWTSAKRRSRRVSAWWSWTHSAPVGQRMVDFQFRPVKARPFVTVDIRLDGG